MTNPELEISTSVSSLLLRIQRVELDVTFHNKLQLWNIFALSFDYWNHKLTMFLWASHLSQIFYILSNMYANSKGYDKSAVYVVSPMSLLPVSTKYRRPLTPPDWCACILGMCNPNNHKLFI